MRWFGRARRPAAGTAPDAESAPARFEPLDPSFVADPYPVFAALRERDPVHRSPAGPWVLTRHRDVVRALADERLGNAPAAHAVVHARNRARYACADVANGILPFLDAPQHSAPRRLVARAFHASMRRHPPACAAIATRLLDGLAGRDELELLADFATPYALAVTAALLGVTDSEAPRLGSWSEWFFYLFTALPSEEVRVGLDRALADFRAWFAALVAERRAAPRDDLVSALLAARGDGAELADAELVDTCMLLFADGVENVDRAIANALHALLRHPDQLELVRREPALVPSAVDECLRFESPAQFVGRVAREELEFEGRTIRKDAAVLLVLGSANRDPAAFAQPDRLDVTRAPNPHLAFGQGRHVCIGAPLVRLELEIALRALLARCARIEAVEEPLAWTPRPGHRWLARLPLHVERARVASMPG